MKKIIIRIPFNVQKFNKEKEVSHKWIKNRLEIFKRYTLKSLVNQTNQDFIALIRVREETEKFIKENLDLPTNIIITSKSDKLTKEFIKEYEWFYYVRLDSDDCYDIEFIDMLHKYQHNPETEVLINQNCYYYDTINNEIKYIKRKSPPAYALVYKVEEYLKGKRHYLKRGHGGAILLKHELLSGNNAMFCIHKYNNTSRMLGDEIKTDVKEILKRFGL